MLANEILTSLRYQTHADGVNVIICLQSAKFLMPDVLEMYALTEPLDALIIYKLHIKTNMA